MLDKICILDWRCLKQVCTSIFGDVRRENSIKVNCISYFSLENRIDFSFYLFCSISVYREIYSNTTFIIIAKGKICLILPNTQFTSYIDYLFLFPCQAQQSHDQKDNSNKKVVVIASTISSVIAMILIFIFIYWSYRNKNKGKPCDLSL